MRFFKLTSKWETLSEMQLTFQESKVVLSSRASLPLPNLNPFPQTNPLLLWMMNTKRESALFQASRMKQWVKCSWADFKRGTKKTALTFQLMLTNKILSSILNHWSITVFIDKSNQKNHWINLIAILRALIRTCFAKLIVTCLLTTILHTNWSPPVAGAKCSLTSHALLREVAKESSLRMFSIKSRWITKHLKRRERNS